MRSYALTQGCRYTFATYSPKKNDNLIVAKFCAGKEAEISGS
jgi:hypothetical protein